MLSLPAFRFAVMRMNMGAFWDVGDNLANILAIFHGRVALFQILQRNFMADWNIRTSGKTECRIIMGDADQHVCASLQTLNNNNADIVVVFMHQQMRNL